MKWCRQNALEPLSSTLFGRLMGERGFPREKAGVIFYVGLEITDPDLMPGSDLDETE
jgi:hypothetical protein